LYDRADVPSDLLTNRPRGGFTFEQWFGAAMTGDFSWVPGVLEPPFAPRTEEEHAWQLALLALLWRGAPERGRLPSPEELEVFVRASPDARAAAERACVVLTRACVVAFDRVGLARVQAVHARIGTGDETSTVSQELGGAFECWLAFDLERAALRARAVERHAGRLGLASAVIEAAALAALAELDRGRVDEATQTARRAARMARTEGLVQEEYFAYLVLARIRRRAGRWHHALRILESLRKVVPPMWRGWLGWELVLAGGTDPEPMPVAHQVPFVRDFAGWAFAALMSARRAGLAGQGAPFRETMALLRRELADLPTLRDELVLVEALADPERAAAEAPVEARPWLEGREDAVPAAARGLASVPRPGDDVGRAYVVVFEGRPARRVLAVGAPLATSHQLAGRLETKGPGRTEVAISALALAGPGGRANADLFRDVYGFGYTITLHQGVLDVLVHRVRKAVEGLAVVEREDERVSMRPLVPFAVPDPRSEEAVDARVLRVLARTGRGTAREAAEELGIPLRTVQAALRDLVMDGACSREGKGRGVVYRVEDTTFGEPTRFG
jgi:tetratricopeptide (TPR) repeat protein